MSESLNSENVGTETSTQGTENVSQETEAKQSVAEYITAKQMNSAITNHLKRSETQLKNEIASLKEMLAGVTAPRENDDSSSSNTGSSDQTKTSPEFLRMQKQVEEMRTLLDAERKAKEAESEKAKEARMRSEVLKVLSENKVEKGDQVYRLVQDKLIYDSESGEIKLRIFDKQIGIEDDRDLPSGLNEWLNTDGQHFLPPRNTAGSGASTGSGSGSSGRRTYTFEELNRMAPKDLAKVDIEKVLKEQNLL